MGIDPDADNVGRLGPAIDRAHPLGPGASRSRRGRTQTMDASDSSEQPPLPNAQAKSSGLSGPIRKCPALGRGSFVRAVRWLASSLTFGRLDVFGRGHAAWSST